MRFLTNTSTFIVAAFHLAAVPGLLHSQLLGKCLPDSPERHGGFGCSTVGDKPLPHLPTTPLFWHLDRFASPDSARAVAGPASLAFEATGSAWLSTVESDTSTHHGGQHITTVGPLHLPSGTPLAMALLSASFAPGNYSFIHHHTGIEAIYVLEGDACYQTASQAFRRQAGQTLTIPANTLHRAVALGRSRRYVFAVIIHDARLAATVTHAGPDSALAACP